MNNLKEKNMNNQYLLHEAVQDQNIQAVIDLLAADHDVNACDNKGNTPLHLAYNYKIIKLLLAAGADIHARCKLSKNGSDGDTPLISMIVGRYVPGVQLLLQAGADANDHSKTVYETPLHLATGQFFNNFAIIELLLKFGANPNAQDSSGCTALHNTAVCHVGRARDKVITLLKKYRADITIKNNEGKIAADYMQS